MISEKDAAIRRRKVKVSAYTLFQERGVDSVTFGNIAAHSGVSESSIYHYFPKKTTLMLELHKYLWRVIAQELKTRTVEQPAFQEASGHQQVAWLIDAFEQVHHAHPGYLKFALECKLYWIRKQQTISHQEYEEITAPVMEQFSQTLQRGVEDKSVCLPADFDSCCFLLWGILRSYIEQMVVLEGLCGDKGEFSHYFQVLKMFLLQTLHA